MSGWVISVPIEQARALGTLRCRSDLTGRRDGDLVWLRALSLDENLDLELRKLPGAQFYSVTDDWQLIPRGARLPRRRLDPDPWTPLDSLLTPVATPRRLPPGAVPKLSLTLVRGGSERLATALVTSLPEWATYVESAPQLRTSRLMFLVERSGETWIMGTPLPPLSGVRCYELDGLFVPAGFVWSPAVDSQTMRLSLGLAADEVAMFEIDGAWRRAARTEFVKGSRAAVRATLARSAHAGL